MKYEINRTVLDKAGLDAGQNKCWDAVCWYVSKFPKMKIEVIKPEEDADSFERYCSLDKISEHKIIMNRKLTKNEGKILQAFIDGLNYANFSEE